MDCPHPRQSHDRQMFADVTATAADRPARRAAVLGSPIKHSLSPVLHGAAYQALGLHGWHYDMIECDEPGLPPLIDGMGPEWAGLSLTMPLKRAALAVADEVSPLAQAVGAANTMVFPPGGPAGGRRADNTDVAGMVAALREAGVARVRQAVILGAGGTAQSALAAVRELGHRSPAVLVRNLARTAELRETAERLGMRPTISGRLFEEPLPDADLVISTLPGGAADPLRSTRWRPDTTVLGREAAGCRGRPAVRVRGPSSGRPPGLSRPAVIRRSVT
jgi:shikimate dehydrogenase